MKEEERWPTKTWIVDEIWNNTELTGSELLKATVHLEYERCDTVRQNCSAGVISLVILLADILDRQLYTKVIRRSGK